MIAPDKERLQRILAHYWGYPSFREKQFEVIRSVLSGGDTLALLPTGGGKSLCYQIPVMASEGMGLVISPLISLMIDQTEKLLEMGISAVALTSQLSADQIQAQLKLCLAGNVKFLYLSPERLADGKLQNQLKQVKICLIAVDEAHCISQWGYDFRPSYLGIASVRQVCPEAPFLALTATATKAVRKDIQEKLNFKNGTTLLQSFLRKNLCYQAVRVEAKPAYLVSLLNETNGSCIVYVRTRLQANEIFGLLCEQAFTSSIYHAGLSSDERAENQREWITGRRKVMVATNAFGMGIDKPDVRLVVHYGSPSSPEAYYQEAGRAGRDGLEALAVLLWNNADFINEKAMIDERYAPAEKAASKDLYEKETLARSKLSYMEYYARTSVECRQQVLLLYFSEELKGRCGSCDNCEARRAPIFNEHVLAEVLTHKFGGVASVDQLLVHFPLKNRKEVICAVRRMASKELLSISPRGEVALV